MSFAEKLIAAVKTAEAGIETEPGKPFRAVLEQFADTLQTLGIGLRIEALADPRKLGVWLYPKHRPSRGSHILTFFFDGDAIIASGDKPTRLPDPDLLEAWLLEFVKKPAFVESLGILREEATLPVEAQLRVNDDGRRHEQDMVVAVAALNQEALDALAIAAPTLLEVERAVQDTNLRGARLEIRGTRIA